MKGIPWIATLGLTLMTTPVAVAQTADAPAQPCVRSATDSPRGLMKRFRQAYECGDFEAYALLFTRDFRFLSDDERFRARHPEGMTRDEEVESARHLFEGYTKPDGEHAPLAVHIELRLDSLVVSVDPEWGRPESHQLVTVGSVRLIIDVGGIASLITIGDRHDFHVVRGEAALLDAGQRGDADHWYIHTWIEHVDAYPLWGYIRTLYR